MNKIWIFSLLFIFVFFTYFLLVPRKIYKKENYYVEKILNINDNLIKTENHDGYFYLEKECGYFSLNNGITHYKKCSDNEYIFANNLFYIIYKKSSNEVEIFSPYGEYISKIATNGYPFICNNLPFFYIIKNNNRGFSLYTSKGNKLFGEITFTSIISSISIDKNINTLISTIDGKTFLFSSKGEIIFDNEFNNNSEIIITKSSIIDFNGENIAVCSGIDPEYIEIYKKKDGTKLFSHKTDTNFRYSILLRFVKNRLYYEGIKEVKYVNLKNKKMGVIKVKGEINEIKYDDSGNILIASYLGGVHYLTIFSPKSEIIFYKEFVEQINNFCFLNKKTLYFKCNNNIVKITIG